MRGFGKRNLPGRPTMRGIETCWAIGLSNSWLTVLGEDAEELGAWR